MTPAKVGNIGGEGDIVGGAGVAGDGNGLDCAISAGRDSVDTLHVHQHRDCWKVCKKEDEECT